MRIAIHNSNSGFAERWINYCLIEKIDFKLVSCYDSDIIRNVSDCDALLWHHNHVNPKDVLVARQILYSLQVSGKKVFPDFNTTWHFDDKIGQKYLLESIGAPLVPARIFYSKAEAMEWIGNAEFPIVFKLRGGGGSKNVWLIRNKIAAKHIISKAFGRGFRQYNVTAGISDQWRKFIMNKDTFKEVLKAVIHSVYPTKLEMVKSREKGYVYFQDYIAGSDYDIRVIVIADKAFAIKRLVRTNDFRASGSGFIRYSKDEIDIRYIDLAFKLSSKLKTQCIGYDFIRTQSNEIKILEISYGFTAHGYDLCPGYWNDHLEWFEGPFNPYGWMIDSLMKNETS